MKCLLTSPTRGSGAAGCAGFTNIAPVFHFSQCTVEECAAAPSFLFRFVQKKPHWIVAAGESGTLGISSARTNPRLLERDIHGRLNSRTAVNDALALLRNAVRRIVGSGLPMRASCSSASTQSGATKSPENVIAGRKTAPTIPHNRLMILCTHGRSGLLFVTTIR